MVCLLLVPKHSVVGSLGGKSIWAMMHRRNGTRTTATRHALLLLFRGRHRSMPAVALLAVVALAVPFLLRKSRDFIHSGDRILQCTGGCVQAGEDPKCLGELVGVNKNAKKWIQVGGKCNELPEQPVVHVNSSVTVYYYTSQTNINHAFHDDFWSVLAMYGSSSSSSGRHGNADLTVVYDVPVRNTWIVGLLQIAAKVYGWKLADARQQELNNHAWVCSTSETMYINGYVRDLKKYRFTELPRIRSELRSAGAQDRLISSNAAVGNDTKRERIVIYTRMDSPYRQLKNVNVLTTNLLDSAQYDIEIIRKMPTTLSEQIQVFGAADLLIAPNGGWSPNVLWMSDTSCLVEIHLYKVDSWIQMFGLSTLFRTGNFMVTTGDYFGSPSSQRLKRAGRKGGDDDILSDLLLPDLKAALRRSPECRRFLKE